MSSLSSASKALAAVVIALVLMVVATWLLDESLQIGEGYWYVYKELPEYYQQQLVSLSEARKLSIDRQNNLGEWHAEEKQFLAV